MHIKHFDFLEFIPASHENPTDPGVVKKILIQKDELSEGRIQMINWGKLRKGRSFVAHYHEDMTEVFVIVSGIAEITVQGETCQVTTGDVIIIPKQSVHKMTSSDLGDCHYIAIGISSYGGGKTIVLGT